MPYRIILFFEKGWVQSDWLRTQYGKPRKISEEYKALSEARMASRGKGIGKVYVIDDEQDGHPIAIFEKGDKR